MDTDARRRVWDGVADGYAAAEARGEEQLGAVAEWFIEVADPHAGHVILDLAAGAGALSHQLARSVDTDVSIICSDFAPGMVEAARAIGADAGLTNIEYRVLDAEQLDLEPDSVDVVLCRSALMLMPDVPAALAEARRVLRPGGVYACSVFSNPASNPWVVTPLRVFVERGLIEPPMPNGPGMFALGSPGTLDQVMVAAGFDEVDVRPIDFTFRWADDDAMWRVLAEINARLKPVIAAMDAEEKSSTREAVAGAFAAFRHDDGAFEVPAQVLAATGR
ncbi:MAG: methyltransferase domain-containing protein [Actinomycetota bacterium]